MAAAQSSVQILRHHRGRLRLGLGAATPWGCQRAEALVLQVPGVARASASALTRTLLVCFAPGRCSVPQLVAAAEEALAAPGAREDRMFPTQPLVLAAVGGVAAHGVVDMAFYALAFAGPFPALAALGGLHLAFDLAVWGSAVGAFAWWSRGRPRSSVIAQPGCGSGAAARARLGDLGERAT